MEVEFDAMGRCLGRFIRAKVRFDVSKPLKCCTKIRLNFEGDICWVDFRYEKLQEFCFACGILGHLVRDCGNAAVAATTKMGNFPYGLFLCGSQAFHQSNGNGGSS